MRCSDLSFRRVWQVTILAGETGHRAAAHSSICTAELKYRVPQGSLLTFCVCACSIASTQSHMIQYLNQWSMQLDSTPYLTHSVLSNFILDIQCNFSIICTCNTIFCNSILYSNRVFKALFIWAPGRHSSFSAAFFVHFAAASSEGISYSDAMQPGKMVIWEKFCWSAIPRW